MVLVVEVVSCGDAPCFFQAFRLQEALQAMTLGSRRWLSNAVDRKKRADLEAFRATHNGYGLEVYRMLCCHTCSYTFKLVGFTNHIVISVFAAPAVNFAASHGSLPVVAAIYLI
jgi:hypothetical protein